MTVGDFCFSPLGCLCQSLFSFREAAALCSISCLREKYCKLTPVAAAAAAAAAGEFLESIRCFPPPLTSPFLPDSGENTLQAVMTDAMNCQEQVMGNARSPAQPARTDQHMGG